jgi:cyclase
MSTPIRVIPRIDVKGKNAIKGIHLEGLRVVGEPRVLAERYYRDGADEIIYMDVVASLYGRNSILSVVQSAAEGIFIPLTVGGGIRSIDDIVAALRAGADKVALNTAAVRHPEFLTEAARTFGSQCIVLSIEAKKRSPGRWEALTDNGRETTGLDAVEWARQAESLGVGEVLITSIDAEGTRSGFEIELVRRVCEAVSIPVIACGGAGSSRHVTDLVAGSNCEAVSCASIFHFGTCGVRELKRSLADAGYPVRPYLMDGQHADGAK